MQVFITGGSGFVGGHTIERLVAAGHTVRAMARSDRSAAIVEGFGAAAVRCDLETVAAEHLVGCAAVVHAAAYVEQWGPREVFWRFNVRGTERMLAAAEAAGVTRFVHIGTEAALFDGHDLIDIDESQPLPARQRFLYSETKAEAELRVLTADIPEMRTLSLRPRFIWGPRDNAVLPAIVEMAEQGRFAWIGRGAVRTSTCHVANLVHAIELALIRGEGGRAYFVADHGVTTVRDFLGALAATRSVELPDRNVPKAVARPLSSVIESVWAMLRRRSTPPMTRFATYMLSAEITVDTGRARRELGYAPVIDRSAGLTAMTG